MRTPHPGGDFARMMVLKMNIEWVKAGNGAPDAWKADYGLPPDATSEDLLASIQDELDNLTEQLMQVAG